MVKASPICFVMLCRCAVNLINRTLTWNNFYAIFIIGTNNWFFYLKGQYNVTVECDLIAKIVTEVILPMDQKQSHCCKILFAIVRTTPPKCSSGMSEMDSIFCNFLGPYFHKQYVNSFKLSKDDGHKAT